MKLEVCSVRSRSFSCKTDYGKTVGTVGCDFEFNSCIVKSENITDDVTGLAIIVNKEDSVFNSIREVVYGKTRLTERAEHTVRRNTSELACLNSNAAGKS